MKNLSDGELIKQAAGFSCGCDKCLARVEPPRKELLARLERGRKAMEAMEKIEDLLSTGAPLMWARGEYIEEASRWEKELVRIFRDYQQSCKEAADEN